MAYVIAITTNEGDVVYWQGGDVCGEHGDEAARFMSKADVDATISLLQRFNLIPDNARAVDLGEVL